MLCEMESLHEISKKKKNYFYDKTIFFLKLLLNTN